MSGRDRVAVTPAARPWGTATAVAAGTLTLLAGAAVATPAIAATRRSYENTVVSVAVTYQEWDDDRPWAKRKPGVRRAAAVVVEGPYLLTTAQMVANATFLQAEKFGRSSRAGVRLHFVDREVDLALLAVDDPGYFSDLRFARLAEETPIDGTVVSVRWREQQLESSTSRIKRMVVESSWFGRLEHPFLAIQTDLDGGGWSEPVFLEDRLMGVTVSQDEQRARVIPVEILARFLERARAPGAYSQFPVFGAQWQVNEDPALSAWLGQTGEPQGVLVRQIPWGSSVCGVLKQRDILMAVDDHPIDAIGYVAHPRFGQVRFTGILAERHIAGDVVPVRVLREGKPLDLEVTLRGYPAALDLVPGRRGDEPPSYLVAGGLVFRELDAEYLRTWGREWPSKAPLNLIGRYYLEQAAQTPERRRIIILRTVLPASYNIGYQGLEDLVVESVNGEPVDALEDIDRMLKSARDGFHTIVLEPNPARREIALDAAGLQAATAEILKAYRVPVAMRLPPASLPEGGPACPGDY